MNDDNFNENPLPYMNYSNIQKVFINLEEEYETKTKILHDVFKKIVEIFEDNNLKMQLINDMIRKLTSSNVIYEKNQGNFILTLNLHLANAQKEPSIQFTLRNTKTSRIYNDVIYAYRMDTRLSHQFMMVFKNIFPEYYCG